MRKDKVFYKITNPFTNNKILSHLMVVIFETKK